MTGVGTASGLLAFALVAVVVGGYLAWVVKRYRREQEAKRIALEPPLAPGRDLPPPGTQELAGTSYPVAPPQAPPAAVRAPAAAAPEAPTGVALLLQGVALPCGLSPLTTFTPRPEVVDQVVFVTTDFPADVVRPQLEEALAAAGVGLVWVGPETAELTRGVQSALLSLPLSPAAEVQGSEPAYPVLPPLAVVADIWIAGS